MTNTHIYADFPEDLPKCPYCGEPLELWQATSNDITWEEETNGSFNYEEKCAECGRMVNYRLNFIITCAVVEEEKDD